MVGTEPVFVGEFGPRAVDDLYDVGDAVFVEQFFIHDRRKGAKVEATAPFALWSQDTVHGSAHRLHDLWCKRIESDHGEIATR